MLDLVCVFSTCGLVLWSRRLSHDADGLISGFVRDVLLTDHTGRDKYDSGNYIVKWTLDNNHNLVFVAVYLNIANMFYIDTLLGRIKSKFVDMFGEMNFPKSLPSDFQAFDPIYDRILDKYENSSMKSAKTQPIASATRIKKHESNPNEKTESSIKSHAEEENDDEEPDMKPDAPDMSSAFDRLKLGRRGRGGSISTKTKAASSKPQPTTASKKSNKRSWNMAPKHVEVDRLDHTAAGPSSGSEPIPQKIEIRGSDDDSGYETSDIEIDDSSKSSNIFGYFQGLIGKKLEREDLGPALEAMKKNLMTKNVAVDITDAICESVCVTLIGKSLSSLQINSAVRNSIEETLMRILAPSNDVDILHRIRKVNSEEKRPFSIVFVGVNGVGKSTSLSKICYYLLSKRLTVSMVACDTFRAGAVEQLKTHANALGVELFQRGYNRDPSSVAMDGIENARRQGHDVVLIDTAGRMQDNEPLIRALSKLIVQNRPDLVLFVGEALVGNDGVDQLTKFNVALGDLSSDYNKRMIDGIVLTKFDTIDDKVGAAISMTYTAGIPIMFVGIGQDYGDMRRMNVKSVIKKLLK